MKRFLQSYLLFLILVLLLIEGCSPKPTKHLLALNIKSGFALVEPGYSPNPNQHHYRSLTNSELKGFLSDNKISPLAIKQLSEATIVLYETKNEMGSYALSKDEMGMMFKSLMVTSNNSDVTPVSLFGSQFITVIINDEQMLREAYKITVIFNDGYKAYEIVSGKKGHIIVDGIASKYNRNPELSSVIITDKVGNILYKGPKP